MIRTQKLVGGSPIETYQNLDHQHWDGKGNLITLADSLNSITHSYTYDTLDRLLTANGAGTNPYSQSYQYDRIGNITYKSDVGNYTYLYNNNKPHAVRSAGNITLQYELNGNMTQRAVTGGITLDITCNYNNKPSLIKKNGSNYVQLTYDGNAERVKKYNYTTGQSVLYFGELYEKRSGAGTIHVFAANQRITSVFLDGTAQFYHTNHLGSASVITDSNGDRKEQMEYFPFGTYRSVGIPTGTYDFDINFPDVFYTFTGQEEDDELGFYNFKARLYDPVLGRFISADTIVPNPEDPQSLNRYSYCLNNPLRYIDPTGNEETDPGPENEPASDPEEGITAVTEVAQLAQLAPPVTQPKSNEDEKSEDEDTYSRWNMYKMNENKLAPPFPNWHNPPPTDDGWYSRYGAYFNIQLNPEVFKATAEITLHIAVHTLMHMITHMEIAVIVDSIENMLNSLNPPANASPYSGGR